MKPNSPALLPCVDRFEPELPQAMREGQEEDDSFEDDCILPTRRADPAL